MHSVTLNNDNRLTLAEMLAGERWIVACLCAAWCGTCSSYRAAFDELASRHQDKIFVWIDIEDQADVVGDLDIDNFPTLLLQRHETVAFFGTVLPDTGLANRLIEAQTALGDAELVAQARSSEERLQWQRDCNLRTLLRDAD
jgi:thiol-disulfide isomerase/thioredoxin